MPGDADSPDHVRVFSSRGDSKGLVPVDSLSTDVSADEIDNLRGDIDSLGELISAAGTIPVRSADPDPSDVPDGRALLYVSDGSDGVAGAAGELVTATMIDGTLTVSVGVDTSAGLF